MAVEAASSCLLDNPDAIELVYFASVSAPFRERQLASTIATACDLPPRCQAVDFGGSLRAGVGAVITAAAALKAARNGSSNALVVAADARIARPGSEVEGLFGDGAVAVRVGTRGVLAEIVSTASTAEHFTHFWRRDSGQFVEGQVGRFADTYGYQRSMDAVLGELLESNRLSPSEIRFLCVGAPDPRAAASMAASLGFDSKRQMLCTAPEIGCLGTASPLLALAAALERAAPDDWIILAGYGEGADAILLRGHENLAVKEVDCGLRRALESGLMLQSYEQFLSYRGLLGSQETGEAISNVLEFKELNQLVRLHGSRCRACGVVQFPPATVCVSCHSRDCLEDSKISRFGRIFTYTIDHLISSSSFSPLPMAVVDLDDGCRVYVQVTDFLEDELKVDCPVRMTYRKLYTAGPNHHYFWKARPPR